MVALKVVELYGMSRTFGRADTAAHAFCRGNFSLVIFVGKGSTIGTGMYTGHARDTFALVNLGNLGANIEVRLSQYGGGP